MASNFNFRGMRQYIDDSRRGDLFRVLIIDDVAGLGRKPDVGVNALDANKIQESVRGYFATLLDIAQYSLSVDFVQSPEEGVTKWQNEIYDLTLVDSDFQKSPSVRTEDKDKRSFLDLDVEFIGAYLYRFLYEMIEKDQKDDDLHFRDGCKVALWTGLNADDPKNNVNPQARAIKLFSILGDSLVPHSFIPKSIDKASEWQQAYLAYEQNRNTHSNKTSYISAIENVIADIVSARNTKKICAKSWMARALTWYRTLSPEVFCQKIGHSEFVSEGWLSCDENGTFTIDECGAKKDNSLYLSPALRRGGTINECLGYSSRCEKDPIGQGNETRNICSWPKGCSILTPNASGEFAHGIIAAATPLTGCSAIGNDQAIALMSQKIAALLQGSFEQIVLKTVYLDSLDQWNCLHWPQFQAQSHHRTRCLRSTKHPRTLWNTGITALESFTPKMMNEFLRRFQDETAKDNFRSRVIVSLGSKFPQHNLSQKAYRSSLEKFECSCDELRKDLKCIWEQLFKDVFGTGSNCMKAEGQYQTVEINVRHYLRECVAYHLGGHEYLSPSTIDDDVKNKQRAFSGCYADIDLEFSIWLEVLNEVAKDYNKKLFLKLPFRGDVLHWMRLIRDKSMTSVGDQIAGITLINAFKSGAGETTSGGLYAPAWYGLPDGWGDAHGKQWTYQMSGEELCASRNELLGEVFKLVADSMLDVHVSGGVVDAKGIRYCSPAIVRTKNCAGCGVCVKNEFCKSNAIRLVEDPSSDKEVRRKAKISPLECKSCGACVERQDGDQCWRNALVRPKVQIGTWALMDLNLRLGGRNWNNACTKTPPVVGVGKPRIIKCLKCEACSVKCQHEAFTKNSSESAQIDYGRCVNCKECLDQCPHNAIVVGNISSAMSTELTAVQYDVKGQQRINPRIAFCLHELCNGCGKCSRTFYCDTFKDRRGFDFPPIMDSRNCTGCGLCAQTCPNGAIQLFDPRHFIILIAQDEEALKVWKRRFTAYEIPHLAYLQNYIDTVYDQIAAEASAVNGMVYTAPNSIPDEILWKFRTTYDRFFDKLSDKYEDERINGYAQFAQQMQAFTDNASTILMNNVAVVDAIKKWLIMAWSDPGQILRNSPVVFALDADQCVYCDTSSSEEKISFCGFHEILKKASVESSLAEVNKRLIILRGTK